MNKFLVTCCVMALGMTSIGAVPANDGPLPPHEEIHLTATQSQADFNPNQEATPKPKNTKNLSSRLMKPLVCLAIAIIIPLVWQATKQRPTNSQPAPDALLNSPGQSTKLVNPPNLLATNVVHRDFIPNIVEQVMNEEEKQENLTGLNIDLIQKDCIPHQDFVPGQGSIPNIVEKVMNVEVWDKHKVKKQAILYPTSSKNFDCFFNAINDTFKDLGINKRVSRQGVINDVISLLDEKALKVVTVHGGRLRSSDLGEELEGIELLLPA